MPRAGQDVANTEETSTFWPFGNIYISTNEPQEVELSKLVSELLQL